MPDWDDPVEGAGVDPDGVELIGVEAADDELRGRRRSAARARRARGQGESRSREGNWQED